MTDHQDHDPQLAFLWEAADGWKEYQSLITGIIEKLDWEDLPKVMPAYRLNQSGETSQFMKQV